jgi:hypothetical protein
MTEKEKVTKNYGRLFYRIVYLNRVPLYFRLEQNTTTKQKETFVKRDQFPHPLLSQATSMPHPIVSKVQEKENQNPIVTIPRLHTPTFLFIQRRERERWREELLPAESRSHGSRSAPRVATSGDRTNRGTWEETWGGEA